MSENKNHSKSYTAEDIRRYMGGKMSSEEMHAMEKASLNDPFLADALEGYGNINESQADAGVHALHERLHDRTRGKILFIGHSKKWWRIAAAAIVILVAGFASYFLITNPTENTSIAQQETALAKDSGMDRKSISNDSTVINPPVAAKTEKETESEKKVDKEETAIIQKKDKTEKASVDKPANAFADEERSEAKSKSKPAENKEADLAEKVPAPKLDQPKAEDAAARKAPLAGIDKNAISQPNVVRPNYFRGRVVDANNQPVPFANISIKNTNSNSYADAKGNFYLIAADSQLNVEIKSVGFINQNLTLTIDSVTNRIILKPGPNSLKEAAPTVSVQQANRSRSKRAEGEKAGVNDAISEAEPVDGWGLYQLYLLNNVRIPSDARQNYFKGSVELSFLVHEKGELSDFRIEKPLCPSCDREAIRLVKEGPKWELNFGKKAAKVYTTVVF